MNITATLLAQIAAFIILIWMVNRLLWGPLTEALEKRRARIAEGLSAADKSKQELADAEVRVAEIEKEARSNAAEIIANSEKRAQEIIKGAKATAREEGERIKQAAQSDIDQQLEQAKESLSKQVSELAVMGAERILQKEIDRSVHTDALKDLENRI